MTRQKKLEDKARIDVNVSDVGLVRLRGSREEQLVITDGEQSSILINFNGYMIESITISVIKPNECTINSIEESESEVFAHISLTREGEREAFGI